MAAETATLEAATAKRYVSSVFAEQCDASEAVLEAATAKRYVSSVFAEQCDASEAVLVPTSVAERIVMAGACSIDIVCMW